MADLPPRNLDPKYSFQGLILTLQRSLGRPGLYHITALRHADRRRYLPHRYHFARARPQPWRAAYVQPRAAPKMAAMARTRTASSITISSRWS